MALKKRTKEQKDLDNSRAETIKEIYLHSEEIKLPQQALNWTAVVIVSLLFGLIAGFFGSWWQIIMKPAWLYPVESTSDQLSGILDLAAEQNNNIKMSFDDITIQNLSNQSVLIYINNYAVGADEWESLYTEDNLQGNGLIITSDGWIVTTKSVINDVNEDFLLITNDRQGFKPVEFVLDSYNDLIFVKIDAIDLSPITIRSANSTKFGDELLVLKNTLRFHQPFLYHTKLIGKNYTPIENSNDFLHSTDKNDSLLILKNDFDNTFIGAPLANSNGDVIGIVNGAISGNGTALNGFNLQVAVRNFLSSESSVSHNSLGVNYIDLAEVVGLPTELNQGYSKGALVYGNADLKIKAVVVDSAAANAKLEAGDIILSVNDQNIESGNSLNKLLQEYPLGSTITLSVLKSSGDLEDVIVSLDINQ